MHIFSICKKHKPPHAKKSKTVASENISCCTVIELPMQLARTRVIDCLMSYENANLIMFCSTVPLGKFSLNEKGGG